MNKKMNSDNVVQNKNNHLLAERTEICPECGSKNITTDPERAEIYCEDCGIVIEEGLVDLGQEWRAFDQAQRLSKARTGPPSTYTIHDKGLGSKSNSRKGDTLKYEEKRAIFLLTEIHRICSILKLNDDFREQASYLSRKIVKSEFGRYQDRLLIATAIIYLLCKQRSIPIGIKKIIEASAINNTSKTGSIRKTSQAIKEEFGIATGPLENRYIQRFCSNLGLKAETATIAMKINEKYEEQWLFKGKAPQGIAAACIYTASVLNGEKVKQRYIAKIANVSEQTIRKRLREIRLLNLNI